MNVNVRFCVSLLIPFFSYFQVRSTAQLLMRDDTISRIERLGESVSAFLLVASSRSSRALKIAPFLRSVGLGMCGFLRFAVSTDRSLRTYI